MWLSAKTTPDFAAAAVAVVEILDIAVDADLFSAAFVVAVVHMIPIAAAAVAVADIAAAVVGITAAAAADDDDPDEKMSATVNEIVAALVVVAAVAHFDKKKCSIARAVVLLVEKVANYFRCYFRSRWRY